MTTKAAIELMTRRAVAALREEYGDPRRSRDGSLIVPLNGSLSTYGAPSRAPSRDEAIEALRRGLRLGGGADEEFLSAVLDLTIAALPEMPKRGALTCEERRERGKEAAKRYRAHRREAQTREVLSWLRMSPEILRERVLVPGDLYARYLWEAPTDPVGRNTFIAAVSEYLGREHLGLAEPLKTVRTTDGRRVWRIKPAPAAAA